MNIFIFGHLLKTKVLNLFIRTGVHKCQPFPTHSTRPLSPIGHKWSYKSAAFKSLLPVSDTSTTRSCSFFCVRAPNPSCFCFVWFQRVSTQGSRAVLSEAVDWCICFTRKIQHAGDWERSRPQGPKYIHNFLMTVRPLRWACGHLTEMLLI